MASNPEKINALAAAVEILLDDLTGCVIATLEALPAEEQDVREPPGRWANLCDCIDRIEGMRMTVRKVASPATFQEEGSRAFFMGTGPCPPADPYPDDWPESLKKEGN